MMNNFTDDTICAPATAVGAGAINIIRISGPRAFEITDSIVSFNGGGTAGAQGYTLKFGTVSDPSGHPLDEVLAAVFRAPHSYTGEDSVELYCHASSYIVSELLGLLIGKGCRLAQAGEFTRRAFTGGKMDLAQAEAVADLIASKSAAAHRIAIAQLKGGFSRRLAELRDKMKSIAALVELELDFSEEEVEFANRAQLEALIDEAISEVDALVSSFRAGNAIKNGVPVAIVGAANSGKSTLLNALVGEERALVSDIAGTTRDTIEETLTLDGIAYRFIDTAGLRQSDDRVEKMGIERSYRKLSEAMIVIEVLDGAAPLDELRKSHSLVAERIQSGQKHITVRGKVDIYDAINPEEFPTHDRSYGWFDLKYPAFGTYDLDPSALAEKLGCRSESGCGLEESGCSRQEADCSRIIDISAKTGEGMDTLRNAISACGRSLTGFDPSDVVVANERHYAALSAAATSLRAARKGTQLPTELLAEDLRAAISDLGAIVGEISSDEVLGEIFGKFCIGK